MPRIQLLDERKYPLPNMKQNDGLPYYRWEHRATLGRGLRVFMAFLDNGIYKNDKWKKMPEAFIEEITHGKLELIEEEELFNELHNYAQEIGLLQIQFPIAKE